MTESTSSGAPMDGEQIKAYFIEQRGYWRPWTEAMLAVNPGFLRYYARYAGYPAQTGPLTARMVELIYVALDSSSTHLFESGLQTHMKRAIEAGASAADIFDVLRLLAIQGMGSVCRASRVLADLAGEPAASSKGPLQDRIDRFGAAHGLFLNDLSGFDPDYVGVLLDFVELGKPVGGLSPLESSLIQLALHACFTAFDADAVRSLISTALKQGARREELLQAIQLGAHLSVHGTALGVNTYVATQGAKRDGAG